MSERILKIPMPPEASIVRKEDQLRAFFGAFPGREVYPKTQERRLFESQIESFLRQEYPLYADIFNQVPQLAIAYAKYVIDILLTAKGMQNRQQHALQNGNIVEAIRLDADPFTSIHLILSELEFTDFLPQFLAETILPNHPLYDALPVSILESTGNILKDNARIYIHLNNLRRELRERIATLPFDMQFLFVPLSGQEALAKLQKMESHH